MPPTVTVCLIFHHPIALLSTIYLCHPLSQCASFFITQLPCSALTTYATHRHSVPHFSFPNCLAQHYLPMPLTVTVCLFSQLPFSAISTYATHRYSAPQTLSTPAEKKRSHKRARQASTAAGEKEEEEPSTSQARHTLSQKKGKVEVQTPKQRQRPQQQQPQEEEEEGEEEEEERQMPTLASKQFGFATPKASSASKGAVQASRNEAKLDKSTEAKHKVATPARTQLGSSNSKGGGGLRAPGQHSVRKGQLPSQQQQQQQQQQKGKKARKSL